MTFILIFFGFFFLVIYAIVKGGKTYANPRIEQMIFRDVWVTIETLEILDNSSNIETVYKRLPILQQALTGIMARGLTKPKALEKVIMTAEERYRVDYYDRTLDQRWLRAVRQPDLILSRWPLFCDQVMAKAVERYIKAQVERIKALKTNKGKINRITRVIDELRTLILLSNSLAMVTKIEEAIEEFTNYKEDLEDID
jgi:hypothetical protein